MDSLIDLIRPWGNLLHNSGYCFSLRFDMEAWAAARIKANDHSIVMPTFDPTKCGQGQSFWIDITHSGQTVAMMAARKIFTADLQALMQTGRLWNDNPSHRALKLCDGLPQIDGKLFYRGGLYVDPSHRKSGLSFVLPRLVRSIAIQENIEWQVSHTLGDLQGSGLPFHTYGFTGADLCFDGTEFFPPTGSDVPAYLVHVPRRHFVNQARFEAEFMVSCPYHQLADVAAEMKRVYQMKIGPLAMFGDEGKTGGEEFGAGGHGISHEAAHH